MLSDFENNMQEDARNTILVLKNYDGTNLGEFRKNLATYGAVKVRYDGDTKGGVETLEITVNADNYKAIAAKLAECFITIGSRRYNFMQMIDMEAKVDKTKSKVPRLGAMMVGHKSCGMEGIFSGTAHYNQSVLRQALLDYKNTGEDVYFEMQITNDDPTSDAGRQTIIFYDCNTDGGVLAKFDADGEYLDEEIEGTFEDFSMPESFANLTGFLTN